jgi:hypothetical protein
MGIPDNQGEGQKSQKLIIEQGRYDTTIAVSEMSNNILRTKDVVGIRSVSDHRGANLMLSGTH